MKLSRDEFDKLALEHIDALDRVARAMTSNAAEAEDLVQETYLNALRASANFDLQSFGIKPWLLRIMHNIHSTRRLRESKQPRAFDSEQLEMIEPGVAEPLPNALAAGELDGELDRALDCLAPELRTCLTLWAIDELSYKEIADVMGVPIGTVMSRLHRARQRLGRELRDYARKSGLIRD